MIRRDTFLWFIRLFGVWVLASIGVHAGQAGESVATSPTSQERARVGTMIRAKVPNLNAESEDRLARQFITHLQTNTPMAAEKLLSGKMDREELEARLGVFLKDNPGQSGGDVSSTKDSPRVRVAELLTREPKLASTNEERLALADQFIERLGERNRNARDTLMSGRMSAEELQSRLTVFITDLKAAPSAAPVDPAADALPAIIESYVRANFGSVRDRLSSISFRGVVEDRGRTREFVVFKKRPGKLRMHVLEDGVVTQILGHDGETAWMQASSQPAVLAFGTTATEIATMARFDPPLVGYRERGAEVHRVDKPGSGPVVIRVREKDGTEMVSTIDPKTLVEQSNLTESTVTGAVETRFSDYRKVGALNVPYRHEQWVKGVLRSTIRITDVVAEPGLLDSLFVRPTGKDLAFMDYMTALRQVQAQEKRRAANSGAAKETKR
ncbi:MAG: hypothetical protein U1F61_25510 [Opitutaceae bacterium]